MNGLGGGKGGVGVCMGGCEQRLGLSAHQAIFAVHCARRRSAALSEERRLVLPSSRSESSCRPALCEVSGEAWAKKVNLKVATPMQCLQEVDGSECTAVATMSDPVVSWNATAAIAAVSVAVLLTFFAGLCFGLRCIGNMRPSTRSVETQSQCTYRRDLSAPRFQALHGEGGCWID